MMKKRSLLLFLCAFGLHLVTTAGEEDLSRFANRQNGFIENKGQVVDQNGMPNSSVLYLLNTPGLNVQLRHDGFSYDAYTVDSNFSERRFRPVMDIAELVPTVTRYHRIDIRLLGMNPDAEIITEQRSGDVLNYYNTGVEAGISVHHYAKVIYKNIYPLIDLEFKTALNSGNTIEYDFIVHPGGDPSQIRMEYNGADKLGLDDNQVQISTEHGLLKERIPASFIADSREPVAVHYVQTGERVFGYQAASYDKSKTLIIDPTPDLGWSTFYGGSGTEVARDVAVSGNQVYVAGTTTSSANIATTGAFKTILSGLSDAFLVCFDYKGVRQWATYFGGSGQEVGDAIAVSGNAVFLGGQTTSFSGISTSSLYTLQAGIDGFVARFNTAGVRQYSYYLGGNGSEYISSLAIDGSGDLLFCGTTGSTNFYLNAYQNVIAGNVDAFVGKMDGGGQGFYFVTYAGSDARDEGMTVATDGDNNVVLAGLTYGGTFNYFTAPGTPHQQYFGGDTTDYFLVKYNTNGSRLWGTYYGGSGGEFKGQGRRVATDTAGNIYLTGSTYSRTGISTAGTFQRFIPVTPEAGFLVKFDPDGVRQWGSYFGGVNSEDGLYGVATDIVGNAYVVGNSSSTTGMATGIAYQTSGNGQVNMVVAKFDPNGGREWSTYYGGNNASVGHAIAFTNKSIFISGFTNGTTGFSTPGAHQPNSGGGVDAFIARLMDCSSAVGMSALMPTPTCFGESNGTIVATPFMGIPPFEYRMAPAPYQTSNVFSGLASGGYTVTTRDLDGCEGMTVTTVDDLPQISTTIWGSANLQAFTKSTYSVFKQSGATYNWTATGGTIESGQGTDEVTVAWGPEGTGTLAVAVTINGRCADSSTTNITKTPTSVDEFWMQAGIKVYPNPVADQLSIRLVKDIPESIKLYDNSGRLLLEQPAKKEQTLDMQSLPSGLYHLQIGQWHKKIEKL